jgi:hypothetical protein
VGTEARTINQEPKKALIIGVSEYEKLRPLKFCENDGKSLVGILRSEPLSYQITSLVGRIDWDNMRRAIKHFFIGEDVRSKDTLLFYFSGHGLMDKYGHYYLAPSDIDPADPVDTADKGFSFDELENTFKDTPSRRVIAILDCCFSGAARLKSKKNS